jgi:hypothetical protein
LAGLFVKDSQKGVEMNNHKLIKITVPLVLVIIALLVFLTLSLLKCNDLEKQIIDQNIVLINQANQIEDLKAENNQEQEQKQDNLDISSLLKFLEDYHKAQATYIEKLQEICRENDVSYPIFIYGRVQSYDMQNTTD